MTFLVVCQALALPEHCRNKRDSTQSVRQQ
ncbi:hypothetical protein F3I16_20105 [Pseudomonas sp. L-22-4S-12]|nr:hypothetical protein [Pseudomonas sp. L-22-4S-12]